MLTGVKGIALFLNLLGKGAEAIRSIDWLMPQRIMNAGTGENTGDVKDPELRPQRCASYKKRHFRAEV